MHKSKFNFCVKKKVIRDHPSYYIPIKYKILGENIPFSESASVCHICPCVCVRRRLKL